MACPSGTRWVGTQNSDYFCQATPCMSGSTAKSKAYHINDVCLGSSMMPPTLVYVETIVLQGNCC